MREVFKRELMLSRSSAEVMDVVLDVERVASWISILTNLREVQPLSRYTGVLEDRLGPFHLRADLDIDVHVADRWIALHGSGTDRQIGSRLIIDGRLELYEDEGDQLRALITGAYEVSGKAAQLGASSIRRKGTLIVNQFTEHLERAAVSSTKD